MEQLTQQLKSGRMEILEVPFPILGRGQVLVRNYYSVISAGTEGKTVSDARKGYIAKAKSRKKEVKMVIDMIKSEGLKKTYDVVMNKLEAPSPLGYSCAGEIIGVGHDVHDFKVGDKVACGGSGAFHAEVVAVNKNLCVKIPETIDLKEASFATIAAIAIQGIRQADLRFGENCTVVGLGLVGQLTLQILKAAGIKAIGVDISDFHVRMAKNLGADLAINRNHEGIVRHIMDYTRGYGTDAVIITAGTNSLDPVEFAGEIARKKGRVIIVGAVPTGFSRPNYYKKELDLRMSMSYGPGRYDLDYEEKGIDYPIGYVRFTENRNMQSFIELLIANKLKVSGLITHSFDLTSATEAYDLIVEKNEPIVGAVIEYDVEREIEKHIVVSKKDVKTQLALNIGLIGAGNFAQNAVLPRLKDKVNFIGIATSKSNMSRYVADKYSFQYCADSNESLFRDENIGTVFILTRHDTHASFVIQALEAGKNVYVEKPLAMNLEELELIDKIYRRSGKKLMLGFNRRFSPLTEKMKSYFNDDQKKSIIITVNAGIVPPDHWVHDPKIGGGRIIGEVCHFLDLACFIAGSKVKNIQAFTIGSNPLLNDTVTINLRFVNGSIGTINYFSNGNKNVPKEHIEVYCDGGVYHLNDFKSLSIYTPKIARKEKLKSQNKGHDNSFELTVNALRTDSEMPISFEDIYHSSLLALETIRSISENRIIEL